MCPVNTPTFVPSSSQWDRSTARRVSTVCGVTTTTAPGSRTVWVRGTTAGLCCTWLSSCWSCCGGCTSPGQWHMTTSWRCSCEATPLTPLTLPLLCFLRTGFSYAPTWQLWLHTNGVLLTVAVLVALLSFIVLLLLGSHLYLVSLNTTTWEFMSRHRISYLKHCGADENPFDRGTFHNLWGFFCLWGSVVWEQVYFREGSDQV